MKYRFSSKEKRISLGVYPEVSLKEARERRDKARLLLGAGADPGETRKAEKRVARLGAENTFEAIAREWYAKYSPSWSESHATRNLARLEADVFPWMGARPIAGLTPPEVLDVLLRVEKRGALETAHRLRGIIGQVIRYGVATGRVARDITVDLRGALPPNQVQHYAAITDPTQVGELLRAIDGYAGPLPVSCALRLAPLLFQRPGELRAAEWAEFDLEEGTWEIPAERMKRTKLGKAAGGADLPDFFGPFQAWGTASVDPVRARELTGGQDAVRKARAGDGTRRLPLAPFERVECDAHKLDSRMVVLMPSPHGGTEPRMIRRLWGVVLVEIASRAVLGYHPQPATRMFCRRRVTRGALRPHAVSPARPAVQRRGVRAGRGSAVVSLPRTRGRMLERIQR